MQKKYVILFLIGFVALIVTPVLFFYLATRMEKPKVITVAAPQTEANEEKKSYHPDSTINVLLLSNGKVICYAKKFNDTEISFDELKELLKKEKERKGDFTVVLKPFEGASYKVVVDALDEMQIQGITKYAIKEPTKAEVDFVKDLHSK